MMADGDIRNVTKRTYFVVEHKIPTKTTLFLSCINMADYLSLKFLPLADKAYFNGRTVSVRLQFYTIFFTRKVTYWIS